MNKILITGTAGFIGFHLARHLLDSGFMVVGLDNINDYYDINLKYARLAETGIYAPDETDHTGGKNREYKEIYFNKMLTSVTNPAYRFIRLNLEDKTEIEKLFAEEKFDYVVNLAAQAGVRYSIENPAAYIQSNIVGFSNILEACRHHPVKHLIYASSSSVYGANTKIPFSETDQVNNPVSLYAATKKSNELMAHTYSHLYNVPATGLRFFTVYGPWGRPDMAPMLFANAISKGKAIKVFNNGNMERDFTYIDDIIEGIIRLIPLAKSDHDKKVLVTRSSQLETFYNIFNIGNGSPVNLLSFIETMEAAMGEYAEKVMMPMQDGDVKKTWANVEKLASVTAHKPGIAIEQGVAEFMKWFKTYSNN